MNDLQACPSPPGRGWREAPGEGRKSQQILRPSPCPLPVGEGEASATVICSHLTMPAVISLLNYGLSITNGFIRFHSEFHHHGGHGIFDLGSFRNQPTFSIRIFYDVPGDSRAEHDDVLFHRHGKAGEGSGRESSGRKGIHSANKGFKAKVFPPATWAMLFTMATMILGGGVDTRVWWAPTDSPYDLLAAIPSTSTLSRSGGKRST